MKFKAEYYNECGMTPRQYEFAYALAMYERYKFGIR